MSLVTLIRDYVDVANSSEQLDGYTFSSLVYYTFAFLFTVIKQAIVYFFTFHWLRDLSYFCFTPPSLANPLGQQPLSAFTNGLLEMNASSATKSSGIEHQPLANLLAFSDSGFSTNMGVVFLGFLNGCFSCMHFSAANLVTIQRMLVQGVPAGLCSAFGTAIGQFSFLICILFGFRGLLFPWLALEPLHFLLGAGILLSIASSTAQDRRTLTVQWSAKSSLLIYAFTGFALAWCEQTAIFQWIGNISFGAEPTFLETTPALEIIHRTFGNFQQLVQNSSYLLAFFLGNIVGASFIGYAVQRLFEWILRYKKIAIYYGLIKQANLPLATLIFAFGFGSLPYYGFDYLITKGFGFASHESFFQQTLFSPVNLVSKTLQTKEPSQGRLEDQLALLFTLEGERTKSFAVDTTPFDDGQYLKASQKRPQTFEDLNYRGEHLWTNRLSRISNMREQANQTQSSFLGPIFSWMRSFLWGDGTATNMTAAYSSTSATDTSHSADKQKSAEEKHSMSTPLEEQSNETEGKPLQRPTNSIPKVAKPQVRRPEYSEEVLVNSIKQRKEFSPEKEQIDNYVKEFDRQFDKGFSNFSNADPYSLIEVEDQWQEKRIKEKCYTNPIYTFLLNTEIDAFLRRQPNSHWLSPQEEVLLLKRRQLLSNYYDTLALTNQISTSEALGQLFASHPKSYANTIYNHQFKGTLKVARRLFSVKKIDSSSTTPRQPMLPSLSKGEPQDIQEKRKVFSDKKGEDKRARVIKFDQPLYLKEKNTTQKILFHEELGSDMEQSQQNIDSSSSPLLVSKPTWTQTETKEPGKKSKKEEVVHTENLLSSNNRGVLPSAASQKQDKLKHTGALSSISYPEGVVNSIAMQTAPKVNVQEEKRKGLATSKHNVGVGIKAKQETENRKPNIFLLEQAEPLPLYVSWDDQLRKLIVTNRFQNRGLAGYTFSEFPINNKTSTFFTTWPIPNPFFNKNQFINEVASEIAPIPLGGLQSGGYEENNSNKNRSIDYLHTDSNVSNNNKSIATFGTLEKDSTNEKGNLSINDLNVRKSSPHSANTFQKTNTPTDALGTSRKKTAKKGNEMKQAHDFLDVPNNNLTKSTKFLQNSVDSITRSLFHQSPKNRFLFQTESFKEPITSDMVNALLQWQKLIKENKQLSKEDKQAAKEKIYYWPENLNHSNWSNELIDNDLDFDEPAENVVKKQTLLWEFTPPNHGGFLWPGSKFTK